ncbi:MAG: Hpt domain-containing protein [Parvibaculum sp.]|nr:Hpt domain-containing protein [Parvibaculum sp.]
MSEMTWTTENLDMVAQSRKVTPKRLLPARISREDLIARAEKAIDSMRGEFASWIQEEAEDLTTALTAWLEIPTDAERTDDLFRRAHDLKGQAPTLGYPIVGRIATSLCELLGCQQVDAAELIILTKSHVGAIKAAVRDEVRDETNETAAALASELEAAVNTLYAKLN